MAFQIAIDTGGTFTDVVLADSDGRFSLSKAPTTPSRIFEGIGSALTVAAQQRALSMSELLAATDVLIYATTRSTNAILTSTTARTALITTKGFRDTLTFREGGKLRPFDFGNPYPEPYIPRELTFEVDERISSEGEVLQPLDPDEVRGVLAQLREHGVQAVAVALLWSIENAAHEQLIGELIETELPGVPYTLSSRLNPIIREYRRTSSAAIDASLKPLMQSHLSEMQSDLRASGFDGELLLVTSFGGVLRLDDMAQRPLYSVNSGPAMAPVAGRVAAHPARNLVVCDTGGTSFDVSVVRDGEVQLTRETWLGPMFTGHITGLSSVAVKNVGAGGGSIAWIDSGGLLRVGPQSAGAEPGPACYGLGGTEPTVTDAAVALGYIDPGYFLGGRLNLDAAAAASAIERVVGEPLGLSLQRAAWAILAVANEHMVTAVRDITINQGIDPRDSVLVAGGGAAGLTMAKLAEELGSSSVLIPRTAAALSAMGGLYGDIVTEFTVSRRTHTGQFDFAGVGDALDSLDQQMDEFFGRMQIAPEAQVRDYVVEARYPYQVWELDVPLPARRFDDVSALVQAFHDTHERVFAVSEPGQRVECLTWKGRASVALPKPAPQRVASNGAGPRAARSRPAWWGADEPVDSPVLEGEHLSAGVSVRGPAIVELPTTTVVVYPEWVLDVNEHGDFVMSRAVTAPAFTEEA
ncbi:MAG: hydantoinase/oxoprolinase family protein [Solirubrobacterales bacterium]